MIVGWYPNQWGEPGVEIECGKPAMRKGCCEECYSEMVESGDFSIKELDEMYPPTT